MEGSLSKSKLIEMLYLLMRDAAPTGEVVRIVRMMQQSMGNTEPVAFTSKELQAYATRLATELLG